MRWDEMIEKIIIPRQTYNHGADLTICALAPSPSRGIAISRAVTSAIMKLEINPT